MAFNLLNAQWKVTQRNDPFAGKVLSTWAIGTQGHSPYTNPYIMYRKNADGTVDAYVGDAGSLACDNQHLRISFDGDPSTIETIFLNPSVSGNSGFFANNNKLNATIVEKFKKYSYAIFEFQTDCSVNRFRISLSGSTNALTKVVGNYFDVKAKEDAKLFDIKAKKDAKLFDIIAKEEAKLIAIHERYNLKYESNSEWYFEDIIPSEINSLIIDSRGSDIRSVDVLLKNGDTVRLQFGILIDYTDAHKKAIKHAERDKKG